MRRTERRPALGLLLWVLVGCKEETKPAPAEPSATLPSATAPTTAAPPAPSAAAAPIPACRVLAVEGKARVSGAPVVARMPLDGRSVLTLERDASVSVRHSITTREFELKGPGRFLPCVQSEEHVLVATGQLTTTPGPGARPGAEVLVATPLGVLRYGNGQLHVDAAAEKVVVRAQSGDGWLTPSEGAARRGPEHVVSPKGTATLLKRPADADLVKACQASAALAASRAVALLRPPGPDAGPSTLGDRAAAHVQARQAARAACFSAQAALMGAPETKENARLEMQIRRAEALWKAVPTPQSRD